MKHLPHAGLRRDGYQIGRREGEEEGAEEDQEEGVAEGDAVEVCCYYAGADSGVALVHCNYKRSVTGKCVGDLRGH